MNIDFETKCVGTIGITEFWGGHYFEPDVGACVIKVAQLIDASHGATAPKKKGK